MNFSFSSVLIAVLASNLFIIFMCFILHNKKILIDIGYKLLGIFLFLTILRLFCPFELPITTNVYFSDLLSIIVSRLCAYRFHIADIRFSIWNLMESVWIIGIFRNLWKYLQEYRKLKKLIESGINLTNDFKLQQILTQICENQKRSNRFRIIGLSGISTPMICYIKNPYILLPLHFSYTDKELYYILRHETTHFFKHDLLIKFFLQLLCILYWWNPFIYPFRHYCDIILELRIDAALVHNDTNIKAEYMSCLIDLAKKSEDTHRNDSALLISFYNRNPSCLIDRFALLTNTPSTRYRRFALILPLTLFIIVGYLSSLFYIFEVGTNTMPSTQAESVFILSTENTYAVDNGDGTYDIYFQKIYSETVDSLQYYPDNIKIYKKGTEP